MSFFFLSLFSVFTFSRSFSSLCCSISFSPLFSPSASPSFFVSRSCFSFSGLFFSFCSFLSCFRFRSSSSFFSRSFASSFALSSSLLSIIQPESGKRFSILTFSCSFSFSFSRSLSCSPLLDFLLPTFSFPPFSFPSFNLVILSFSRTFSLISLACLPSSSSAALLADFGEGLPFLSTLIFSRRFSDDENRNAVDLSMMSSSPRTSSHERERGSGRVGTLPALEEA